MMREIPMHMAKARLAAACSALAAIVMSAALSGGARATTYSFMTIDVPGATDTAAYGINGAGQIVGNYSDDSGRPRLPGLGWDIHDNQL